MSLKTNTTLLFQPIKDVLSVCPVSLNDLLHELSMSDFDWQLQQHILSPDRQLDIWVIVLRFVYVNAIHFSHMLSLKTYIIMACIVFKCLVFLKQFYGIECHFVMHTDEKDGPGKHAFLET